MAKAAILLLSLLTTLHALTYAHFYAARQFCEATKLEECRFEPISNETQPLSQERLGCAQDYAKSDVCFYGYSQCLPKDNQTKYTDQMPLVCWNCYMESPARSQVYESFRRCVRLLAEGRLVLSFVALALLLVLM